MTEAFGGRSLVSTAAAESCFASCPRHGTGEIGSADIGRHGSGRPVCRRGSSKTHEAMSWDLLW